MIATEISREFPTVLNIMDQQHFTSNHVQDYKAKMCRDTFMLYANNVM